MRLRNLKDKDLFLENCSYLILEPKNYVGYWNEVFGNSNPIHIEIGMGKGDFIYHMALEYPQINFIGIEKYTGVIARAIKKYPSVPQNLRIINMDALYLKEVFDHEISTIYLNFSDPWPKKRTHKRRLTSDVFLNIYEGLFGDKKRIVMKTDNLDLFAFSLVSLNDFDYKIKDVCLDLANSDIPNIPTEYETKFMKAGMRINYLVAEKE